MTNPKGVAIVPIVVIIAAVFAFGVTGYFFYSSFGNTNESTVTNTKLVNANTNSTSATNGNTNTAVNTNTSANSNVNATTDATKDWKTYTNEELGFSFRYPKTLGNFEFSAGSADTGKSYSGFFSALPQGVAGKVVGIGGTTYDYTYGAGGGFLKYSGFVKEGTNFYMTTNGQKGERISPSKVLAIDNNTTIVVTRDSFPKAEPYSPANYNNFGNTGTGFGAIMNLKKSLPGLQFLVTDPSLISRDVFEQILSTFTFTP